MNDMNLSSFFVAFIQSEQDLRYLVDDGVDVQSFSKVSRSLHQFMKQVFFFFLKDL